MQQPRPIRRVARIADLRRAEPEPPVNPARIRVLAGIILLLFGLLVARLYYLQVLHGERFRRDANVNSSRRIPVAAPRGTVEDARGSVLVTNRPQFTVFVVPADLPRDPVERAALWAELARTLETTPEDLQRRIERGPDSPSDPIPVAEGVDLRTLTRVSENRFHLPGVVAQAEPVRHYPRKRLAAHLLGTIGQVTEQELAREDIRKRGYRAGDFTGKSGVERQYDALLHGTEGGTLFEIDARGRRRRVLGTEEPIPGATLRLCLQKNVQAAAERALGGRRGAVVALDPRNGRVLALASGPTYDPGLFARRPLAASIYKSLIDPRNGYPLQNRAVSSPQPPGSTFKIVTATAGLATRALTAHSTDYCPGFITLGRRARKRCHSVHRAVNLDSAIAASCDVFFYHAGFRIRPTPLAAWAERFGLGQETGIDLPSEKRGTVPSPAWKAEMAPKFGNPDTSWYPGDTANMAIGQGDLQTTPLQMAQVAAGIASGGVIYKPRVLERATDAQGKLLYRMKPEVLHRLPITPEHLRLVAQGMRSVVVGPRGTSHRANLAGVAVAGKSGSAETRGGGPTHAWFICYAPYESPTIAVSVFLETTGQSLHGGADAAPVARAILAAHFGVPDRAAGARGGSRGD